ncbi:putative inactive poly [Canna indica]|uniref:Inactive poly n=1 Tax=Canna indica TaxID=4628 RepID=A0AAQ3JVR8_9LILI|nr:putative inactive poly [Canna indica]
MEGEENMRGFLSAMKISIDYSEAFIEQSFIRREDALEMVKQEEERIESNGMARVNQESEEFITLLHRFNSSIRSLVPHCSLVDVHRIPYSTTTGRARRDA